MAMVKHVGLTAPTDPLPADVLPGSSVGQHRVLIHPMPLGDHPDALLVQITPDQLRVAAALAQTFPLGIAVIDRQSDRATLVNRAFWETWRLPPGRQPDEGLKLRAACRGVALDPDALDDVWPEAPVGDGRFGEIGLTDGRTLRLATYDPHEADEPSLGRPLRWILAEDVTAPKKHRQAAHAHDLRRRESQRLESLSVLAGGIAHDFNNLLLVILANAELLREDAALESNLQSAVTDIRLAAERAAELSTKMLAYSGRGQMVSRRLEIMTALETALEELRGAPETVPISMVPAAEAAVVVGDPDALRQLFLALLINAQESVGVHAITVRCDVDIWSTDALSELYLGDRLVSGPYASVCIVDDGEGIEPSLLSRIFDPFFSTRGPSRGLGLAAAAGIARSHGGTIDVQSAPGQGARARVLLPLVQSQSRTISPPPSNRTPTHEGTIMLVDDESLVRRSARQALEQAGFQVVEAENGEQAFELFARQPERFDLVIMDISMPGTPGDVVAAQMRGLTERPVPLVLSSGYRPQLDLGEDGVADRFLQKPYRRADLVQTARVLLDKD